MNFFLYFLAILCSSALFSLGIPNEITHFGSSAAGFLGITLLYYTLLNYGKNKNLNENHVKNITYSAYLYAFFVSFVHLFASFWLAFFEDFAIFTLGASTLAYFFMAMPFGIVFHYVLKKAGHLRIFAFAAVWLMWEYFKSNDFLAYPWGTAPMVCFNLKTFIQFTDTTGVWGLSFVVPLVSAAAGEILYAAASSIKPLEALKKLTPLRNTFIFTGGLLILLNVYGMIVLNKEIQPEKFLKTVIVQQNGDPWDMGRFEEYLAASQNLTLHAVQNSEKKPDLIVWSETSLAQSYPNNAFIYKSTPEEMPFLDFLKNLDIPLFTGTSYYEENGQDYHYYNSACLLSPQGNIEGLYSKIQLVAFAEYMPFIDNPLAAKFFDKIVGFSSGYTPGRNYSLFSIKNSANETVRFAAPICFEDAFPHICTKLHNLGSELLINMSNDSWSKTASAEYQHFVISSYRALELRTTLLRSTNSGFSVVIDPLGKILYTLPLFKAETLVADVPIYKHVKTPFAVFKDWFPYSIFAILMTYMVLSKLNMIKKAAAAPVPSCHWQYTWEKRKSRIKTVRYYKPLFAVKRIEKRN